MRCVFLHAYLLPQVQAEAEAEVLILDTIRNVAGLEYLFAVSIGLDAKIETTDADRVTWMQQTSDRSWGKRWKA